MAMQYDAVASSRPGNRVEKLMREKEDGKIDKTMWNQPDLRPHGTNQDQDEYGFPLGTEMPSMQVICQRISFTCAFPAPSPESFVRQGFLFRFLSPGRRWKLKSSWVKWQLAITSSFLCTSRYISCDTTPLFIREKQIKQRRIQESGETVEASVMTWC